MYTDYIQFHILIMICIVIDRKPMLQREWYKLIGCSFWVIILCQVFFVH